MGPGLFSLEKENSNQEKKRKEAYDCSRNKENFP
jgi:hypothetical protein